MTRIVGATFAVLLLASSSIAEQRFKSGPYYNFTKLPPERVIVELGKPLHVTEVSGSITSANDHQPLHKVLFELREDSTGKIKAAKTDSQGKFRIAKVKDGKYTFKVTFKGYQSVVGTVIVRAKTAKPEALTVELPVVL